MLNDREHAVVLSGGGAKGAYEVGVLKCLLSGGCPTTEKKPIEPGVLTGTSVGSYNAAVVACGGDTPCLEGVEKLETIWRERIAAQRKGGANGVLRFRGIPSGLLDLRDLLGNPLGPILEMTEDAAFLAGDWWERITHFPSSREALPRRIIELVNLNSMISLRPFHRLLYETIPVEALLSSPRALRVAATDWTAGTLRVFRNRCGGCDRAQIELRADTVLSAIAASSAIPAIFPPVLIDGRPHVDGGVVMNTPLRAAILADAEVIHVVYVDPDAQNIPIGRMENTMDTTERLMVLMMAVIINRDIASARRINEMLARNLEPRGERKMRPVKIHRYRPGKDLGGIYGLLEFSRDRIEALIDEGCSDTAEHDCAACECVLPDAG